MRNRILDIILASTLIGLMLLANTSTGAVHLVPALRQAPDDISYVGGTTGHTLTWVYEAHESGDTPAEYNISIDGEVLPDHLEKTWQDNQKITVSVDGLAVGTHTVTITIWDSGYPDNAGTATDSATVTVTEPKTPEVQVSDQYVVNSYVTVNTVIHNSSNGWIVIHVNNSGSPGEVIGQAPVGENTNQDVRVAVNSSAVTDSLFAMLHNDTGTIGIYEFPKDDPPMKYGNGSIIMDSFDISGMKNASITVSSGQTTKVSTGTVTVSNAVSPGLGWVVIHANESGKPGSILGKTQVNHGENTDVSVDLSGTITPLLFAMLHFDNGTQGTFEFPDGADIPVEIDGSIVVTSFNVTIDNTSSSPSSSSETDDTGTTDTDGLLLPIPVGSILGSLALIAVVTIYKRRKGKY